MTKNTLRDKNLKETIEFLGSDIENGLADSESKLRLAMYGKNLINESNTIRLLPILVSQLKNSTSYLLAVSIAVSYYLGEWMNGHAVLIVLLVNILIGFIMEFQADKTMKSLRRLLAISTKVIRDKKKIILNSEELVPGDVVLLEAGDLVPADLRIIESNELQVNESMLTGESLPRFKKNSPYENMKAVNAISFLLYKSTAVVKGNCKGIVLYTGVQTEIGKIASELASIKKTETPLEIKIRKFTGVITLITIALSAIILATKIIQNENIYEAIETAIALAVASIPEGLPIAVTLTLSYGMIKMARKKIIVNRLSAVETLGSTNIICSDKTGTLTKNLLSVDEVITSFDNPKETIALMDNFKKFLRSAILCNNSSLEKKNGSVVEIGDPLECALSRYVIGWSAKLEEEKNNYKKIEEIPFSSETRTMITIHETSNTVIYSIKGAVEQILEKCNKIEKRDGVAEFTKQEKKEWKVQQENLAQKGQKVIGIAYKETKHLESKPYDKFIFQGIIGFSDPPIENIEKDIESCQKAGILVVMLTGDHAKTAKYIGEKIGILRKEEEVISGDELSTKNEAEIKSCKAFARVTPQQKLLLVEKLQSYGNVVAMTGDGVNDAPALKKAEVGVAMGKRGTQVACDASAIILKNDDFHSIVSSVEQGRIIFRNIQNFIVYLISCNLSEITIIFLLSFFNLGISISPIKILFMNMVTDVFPALALGFTSNYADIMTNKPLSKTLPVIDMKKSLEIIFYSLSLCMFSLLPIYIVRFELIPNLYFTQGELNNLLFMTILMCQLIHVFNMNNNKGGSINLDILKNKFVWIALAICASIIFITAIIPGTSHLLYEIKLKPMDVVFPFVTALIFLSFVHILKKIYFTLIKVHFG